MKALILAGGSGSRMGAAFAGIPKAMTDVCGKPVLLRQIETLKQNGINEFTVIACHLHNIIEDYFGSGDKFGVKIDYFIEDEPLGTAGALSHILPDEDFLFLNGDLVFDFPVDDMYEFHKSRKGLVTAFAHPNTHPYDSSVLVTDSEGAVTDILGKNAKPYAYPNLCNAGIHIVSPEIKNFITLPQSGDFDRDIVLPLIPTGRVYAYKSADYVGDMGTPERLEKIKKDLDSGLVYNKSSRRKAVFVDRDGTLNRCIPDGYITEPSQLELISGAAEAVKIFHSLGYLVIVITNQPVIARGMCTFDGLRKIHSRLETLLGENGAYVDDIYFCPHHPHSGFEGEVPELKTDCDCRKPKPGMILKAAEKYGIDLSASFMAGDSVKDVMAGINAGCMPIYLSEKETVDGAKSFASLYHFAVSLI